MLLRGKSFRHNLFPVHLPSEWGASKMGRRLIHLSALAALVLAPGAALAQGGGREVTGKVERAAGGAALPDVTIAEIGGLGVARTGPDGTFRIRVVAGNVRLLVRAIGYQRKEVLVNAGANEVTVRLEEDPFRLEEVVATGQPTSLEKPNATPALSKVTGHQVTNAAAQALEQALQGKVLGDHPFLQAERI